MEGKDYVVFRIDDYDAGKDMKKPNRGFIRSLRRFTRLQKCTFAAVMVFFIFFFIRMDATTAVDNSTAQMNDEQNLSFTALATNAPQSTQIILNRLDEKETQLSNHLFLNNQDTSLELQQKLQLTAEKLAVLQQASDNILLPDNDVSLNRLNDSQNGAANKVLGVNLAAQENFAREIPTAQPELTTQPESQEQKKKSRLTSCE